MYCAEILGCFSCVCSWNEHTRQHNKAHSFALIQLKGKIFFFVCVSGMQYNWQHLSSASINLELFPKCVCVCLGRCTIPSVVGRARTTAETKQTCKTCEKFCFKFRSVQSSLLRILLLEIFTIGKFEVWTFSSSCWSKLIEQNWWMKNKCRLRVLYPSNFVFLVEKL